MSIKSGEIKQTEATKKCSNTFGKATKLVQSIRDRFSGQIRGFHDGRMYNRLSSVMSRTFYESRNMETMAFTFSQNSFDKLSGFDFNMNSRLIDTLRIKPGVGLDAGTLNIVLPELKIPAQLKFPSKSKFCKITIRLVLYRLSESLTVSLPEEQSLVVKKDQKVLEARKFGFKVPDGCLCVPGLFLEFYHQSGEFQVLLNNKSFNPGSIIAALITPGDYKEIDERLWKGILGFELD